MDFGPSLMDEVFRELNMKKNELCSEIAEQQIVSDNNANVKNEIKEMASKFAMCRENGKQKKQATVKPISAADQITLDSAIAMAQEMASRSIELDDNGHNSESPKTPTSPHKKKFSFKFKTSPKAERRNFSAEAENISDIQSIITDEAKEAYNSLIGKREPSEKSRSESFNVGDKWAPTSFTSSTHVHELSEDEGDVESNPLRLLRSGLTVVPKVRGNKQRFSAAPQTASLARLTASVNRSNLGTPPPVPGEQNALPLPPRDRSKPQLLALKQHQRKHPLLVPIANSNSSSNSPKGSFECLPNDYKVDKDTHVTHVTHVTPIVTHSTFRPNMPVLRQVSCPEPPASYFSNLRKSIIEAQAQPQPADNTSPPKIAPLPPPKPARTCL